MASLPEQLRPIPAGRRKLPREVMEEHQRARVLAAAIEVFAAKGYPSTTVDDIVAAARIGVGSFYTYFSGKEPCLLAAFDMTLEEAKERVVAAAAASASSAERVCLGLQALLTWIEAEPGHARIVLIEIQTGGPAAVSRYERMLDTVAGILRSCRGAMDQDRRLPDSLEETTVSGIAWLLHRRLSLGETDRMLESFEDLAELLLEPYLGEPGAKRALAGAL